MFLITRDGNEGQCFLYEDRKLIAFYMSEYTNIRHTAKQKPQGYLDSTF